MMFRIRRDRKFTTIIATVATAGVLAATLFAPAGFGSSLPKIALWEDDPIVLALPPTVAPGENLDCAIEFLEGTAEPAEPAEPEPARLSATASDSRDVTIYSDPPGVVSWSGTLTGSSAVIPVSVSSSAAPGPVTVYVQSGTADPVSSHTTVVSN